MPHLAAYHAALATASVLAVIAAGVARLVDDRAAATMIRPDRSRHSRPGRRSTAALTLWRPDAIIRPSSASGACQQVNPRITRTL